MRKRHNRVISFGEIQGEKKSLGKGTEEGMGRVRPTANTQTKIGIRIYYVTIISLKPLESVTYLNVFVYFLFLRHY